MRWIRFAGLLVATACTDPSATKDTATRPVADSGGSIATTAAPTPMGRITGTVIDELGQPWADATVNLCREICRLDRTDRTGAFAIEAEAGTWALEVVVTPADPASGWSTPLAPVDIVTDVDRVLPDPITVYRLDPIQTLDAAGAYTLTEGFTIVADPTQWEAPLVTPGADPWLGAVGFDFDTSGLPLDGLDGLVLAAWSVAPTHSHPTDPWPIQVANPGLVESAAAEVWVSDYATQSWVRAGTVAPDATGNTLVGAALSTLGTVLLLQPAI